MSGRKDTDDIWNAGHAHSTDIDEEQTMKQTVLGRIMGVTAISVLWLAGLTGVPAAAGADGANDPAARFRGPLTYDFGVTNVKWEAATPEYSYVTFDLHWSFSWRAKWTEPADKNVTGKPLEVENWDAAWVFVKILTDKDSQEARERNYWWHATLDADPAHHVMPAGATNSVKLTDSGSRALGVFIYRDAVGNGVNDWKGIKLRWNHPVDPSTGLGAGKVDPAKAGVRVFALPMVYVPRGPFKVGSGSKSAFTRFGDGPTFPMARCDPPDDECGSLCDGSWRGGPVVPFLVDAEWSGPSAEGPASPGSSAAARSRARRIGRAAGELWSTFTYPEVGGTLSSLGTPGVLGDGYPTGYESFYCMKYHLTQGQYVEYLNALPPDVAAGRAFLSDEFGIDCPVGSSDYSIEVNPAYKPLVIREKGGLTITLSRESLTNGCGAALPGRGLEPKAPDIKSAMEEKPKDSLIDDLDEKPSAEEMARKQKKVPPVYTARLPFRTCCGFSVDDVRAFAVWAGLRPLSELEFEKACRGPLNPVPYEATWGSTQAVFADTGEDLVDIGLPTERLRKGNYGGGYGSKVLVVRAGCFATPTSDRVSAGATYWGILEMAADAVPLMHRQYLASHGDGSSPAGKPGGSLARHLVGFRGPEDWPMVMGNRGMTDRGWINAIYIGGRFGSRYCRLVMSAPGAVRLPAKPAVKPAAKSPAPFPAAAPSPDVITVSNVKWEADGKESGTVAFDLAWRNSWRAKWTEPAEKNVTGKPMPLESWDAAWVFVKLQSKGSGTGGVAQATWRHAMLDVQSASHQVPAGAVLDVGLTDDGSRGVGVFVYRAAAGQGPVDFKGIKLRWTNTPSPDSSAVTKPAAPLNTEHRTLNTDVSVQAIGMVYVPAGPFRSKTPWKTTFATIKNPDATAPDGCRVPTNAPANASWPNGVNAFYCMKHGINQGLFAAYLNFGGVVPKYRPEFGKSSYLAYGFGRQTIKFDETRNLFVAEQPDLPRNYVIWADILAVTAWAGLRPVTDLEYEKACRGPREVARAEDAWADGVCAPGAGLVPESVTPLPGLDNGASYWGVRGLSIMGCRQEWPGTVSDDEFGFKFKGSHSAGALALPADWPDTCAFGQHYGYKEFLNVGVWILPTDLDSLGNWEPFSFDRTGRFGARAVRTAPFRQDDASALQFDALPNLRGYDVGVFPLSGRFRNDSDKALKVALLSELADTCFPEGAASRAFTAAPKAVTPFRVLTAITAMSEAKASRSDGTVPVKVQAVGGDVLAEQMIRPALRKSAAEPAAISSLGGAVGLRVLNAADRPVSVAIVLKPIAECKPAEMERRVEIPAGTNLAVSFPVPRQAYPAAGIRGMPFGLVVMQGAEQPGELSLNLLNQSRWWGGRKVKSAEPVMGGDAQPGDGSDPMEMLSVLEGKAPEGMPDGFFRKDKPPAGWKAYVADAAAVPLKEQGGVPARGSSAIVGTRLFAPVEREVKVKVSPELVRDAILRVWVNDKIVYDARPDEEGVGEKAFTLHAGVNTVASSWRSTEKPTGARDVSVGFVDAKTGQPLTDLVLDMEGK